MPDTALTWPDMAAQLYDKLTGRGAEISYEFDNFELYVPDSHVESPTYAKWKLNGVLKIRAGDNRQA